MNRKIKFRFFNLITLKFEYVNLSDIITYGGDIFYSIIQRYDKRYSQYTGLKDKNRKEIYEGDILSYGYYIGIEEEKIPCLHKVYWDSNEAGFKQIEIYFNEKFNIDNHSAEIIGNIYENTELLEKEINHAK